MFSTLEFGPWGGGLVLEKCIFLKMVEKKPHQAVYQSLKAIFALIATGKMGRGGGLRHAGGASLPSSMGVPTTQLSPLGTAVQEGWVLGAFVQHWPLGFGPDPQPLKKHKEQHSTGGGGSGGVVSAWRRARRSACCFTPRCAFSSSTLMSSVRPNAPNQFGRTNLQLAGFPRGGGWQTIGSYWWEEASLQGRDPRCDKRAHGQE